MRFRKIYAILNERKMSHPNFSMTDRSNWQKPIQNYVGRMYPLLIIVDDKDINKRVWIGKSCNKLHVTTVQLNPDPNSGDCSERPICQAFTTQWGGLFADAVFHKH